jgi:hypothetical protein
MLWPVCAHAPASSMARLWLATTTALPRSISSVTTALTTVCFYAFDLIELNGDDLRGDPLQVRKATLSSILAKAFARHPVQRAYRGRRSHRLRPCLQARPRRHCVKAQGLNLPLGTLARLAQEQESGLLKLGHNTALMRCAGETS